MNEKYLSNRLKVLKYTNDDMNLKLDNNKQVYLAIIDVPTGSGVIDNEVMSIALIFGLNTHIYFANGNIKVDLEKNEDVMKMMQSLLISSTQALIYMEKTEDFDVKSIKNKHIYLKTADGLFYLELDGSGKAQNFLEGMTNMLLQKISQYCNIVIKTVQRNYALF